MCAGRSVNLRARSAQPYPHVPARARLRCTAIIAMQMVPTSLSKSNVNGFIYNSGNDPAAGAPLGAVGEDLYHGNGEGMTVNCSGTVAITIN